MKQEIHNIKNDSLKRKFYLKNEFKLFLIKSFLKNNYIKEYIKIYLLLKYSICNNYGRIVKMRNRCGVTGRGYGIFKNHKLSRFWLRQEFHKTKILGFKRKSW